MRKGVAMTCASGLSVHVRAREGASSASTSLQAEEKIGDLICVAYSLDYMTLCLNVAWSLRVSVDARARACLPLRCWRSAVACPSACLLSPTQLSLVRKVACRVWMRVGCALALAEVEQAAE